MSRQKEIWALSQGSHGWKIDISRRDSIAPVAKYLQQLLSQVYGYLEVVVPERKQAINGRCLKCGYRLAWLLVGSKASTQLSPRRSKARPVVNRIKFGIPLWQK
jgi:hypothetical protein